MLIEQWNEFKPYFSPEECGEEMDYRFMVKVFLFRLDLNSPMIIHEGHAKNGHAPDSYHYRGQALDFHVPGVSMREVLMKIDRHHFGGAGTYLWWNDPGFHIDFRPMDRYQRWTSPEKGKYIYLI